MINADDLKRMGLTYDQWEAHQRRLGTPIEVRVEGGVKALTTALKAAGLSWEIIHHAPPGWANVAS